MSILIKGMEMPKNRPIQILIFTDGSVRMPLFAYKIADAVEVPTPHGRLIDADALYIDTIRSFDYMDDFLELIEAMPSVIEKED